eukprot:GEMP01065117.1.p1 GENE.GEMP01065117.1~~GEMP01065117.1.p1  ORF type:complete len:365 (+),score=45.54 GEMP01065117.1:212-1306(+)
MFLRYWQLEQEASAIRGFTNPSSWCWLNSLLQCLAGIDRLVCVVDFLAEPAPWRCPSVKARQFIYALSRSFSFINGAQNTDSIARDETALMRELSAAFSAIGMDPSSDHDCHEAFIRTLEIIRHVADVDFVFGSKWPSLAMAECCVTTIEVTLECSVCAQSRQRIEEVTSFSLLPMIDLPFSFAQQFAPSPRDSVFCPHCTLQAIRRHALYLKARSLDALSWLLAGTFVLTSSGVEALDDAGISLPKRRSTHVESRRCLKLPQSLMIHWQRALHPLSDKRILSYGRQFCYRGKIYQLRSLASHFGSSLGGHYISHRSIQISSVWTPSRAWMEVFVNCNDSFIRRCDIHEMLSMPAYLLFYEAVT